MEALPVDAELGVEEGEVGTAELPDEASVGVWDSVAEVVGAAEAPDDGVAVLMEAGEVAGVSAAGSAGGDGASGC